MSNRILFVDDEPMVLDGLRLSFRSMRGAWSMEFASGGEQALRAMEKEPFDVVITDLRMPGMSGTQLLEQVSHRFPQTVRIALSGQCDQETIIQSVGPIHQYLSKPCDRDQLKSKIQQAFALRDLLGNAALKALVSQLKVIPSMPESYQRILAELQSSDATSERLAELISADMGMTAKCLQLVNSAFFGLRSRVSSATEAVKLLGQDILRALVLSSHIFSEFRCDYLSEEDVRWLWNHSLSVADLARTFAQLQSAERDFVENAFTAGLLHDVGKLILASSLKAEYQSVLALACEKNIGIAAAEIEILGCSHAEVGAYLLGIWGLPYSILESVAWHQKPSAAPAAEFSPLSVVHAACVYHSRLHPAALSDRSEMDFTHLSHAGVASREPLWRTTADAAMPTRPSS
jgi:HD-like signal output (HDOD) protein/CheY-like chemotaxis protein